MRPRLGLSFVVTACLPGWFGCHRAEIDLNALLSHAGEGGSSPAEVAASGANTAGEASVGAGGVGAGGRGGDAGGADEAGGAAGAPSEMGGTGGQGDSDDVTPPRLLAITPSDGERGVRSDATIVLRFSEPMNPESTALAVALGDLVVATTWDETGSKLSLTPVAPLAYGTGSDPAFVEAIAYGVSVGRAATDLAGNALDQDYAATFYTSRELAKRLPGNDALIGYAFDSDDPLDSVGYSDPHVGDALDLAMRGFVTFELSALPPETQAVASAILTVDQYEVTGSPFQMGSILLDHVTFSAVRFAFHAPTKTSFGELFASATNETASIDVTAALQGELAERVDDAGQLQFRFRFTDPANPNGASDEVRLRPLRLDVRYLLP